MKEMLEKLSSKDLLLILEYDKKVFGTDDNVDKEFPQIAAEILRRRRIIYEILANR